MSITNLDGYIAAAKQKLTWVKTTPRTTVAAIPFSLFDIAGNPGAGTLSAGNTANGIVPTDALAGYPTIAALSGTGYLSGNQFSNSVACRIKLFDRLFSCGAYAYNANTTLASQPSYSSRVPGANYNNLEIWIEAVTAFTGTPSFQINYLDQGGAAGDTGVISAGAVLIIGRCFRMPLAAGDNGVQQITQVRGTIATGGTFNVNVLREIWNGRVAVAGGGDNNDLLKCGLPQIYADSALYALIQADSTSSGVPEMLIEVADG